MPHRHCQRTWLELPFRRPYGGHCICVQLSARKVQDQGLPSPAYERGCLWLTDWSGTAYERLLESQGQEDEYRE